MANKAKILFRAGDYRIVLVEYKRYVLEEKDGEDALGVERWKLFDECLRWPDATQEINGDFSLPRDMFRAFMKVILRLDKTQDKTQPVQGGE